MAQKPTTSIPGQYTLTQAMNQDQSYQGAASRGQADQAKAISAKFRQGIKMDPTDDAHTVTHEPPDTGASNYTVQPGGPFRDD